MVTYGARDLGGEQSQEEDGGLSCIPVRGLGPVYVGDIPHVVSSNQGRFGTRPQKSGSVRRV